MIGAALAIPAMLLVRRFHRHGKAVAALLVSAFFGLLFSPVSWSHHYVWVVPLLIMLIARMPDPLPEGFWRVVRAAIAPITVFAVFASCVLLIMRNGFGKECSGTGGSSSRQCLHDRPGRRGHRIGVRVIRRRLRARANPLRNPRCTPANPRERPLTVD